MVGNGSDIYAPCGLTCRCGDALAKEYSSMRPVFACRRCGMRYIVTTVVSDPTKDAAWQSERRGVGW